MLDVEQVARELAAMHRIAPLLLDRKGHLRHEGGVLDAPGLYAIGLPVMRRRKSTFIYGAADDACKTAQAAALGNVGTISLEECRAFDAETGLQRRSHRVWKYLAGLEARWDRQMSSGKIPLFP